MIKETTTSDLIADWLIPYPQNSRDAYRRDVHQFAEWLVDTDLLDARRTNVQRWLAHLIDADLTAATVRRKASALSSFYEYAAAEDLIGHSPCEHIRRPKGESAAKLGLPLDKAQALIATAKAHSRTAHALVWLMAGAGLRVTEACTARIDALAGNLLTVTVKGGHTQTKPLSAPVLTAVTAAVRNRTEGPILTNRDGAPLTRPRAWELVGRLAATAGIDDCTPHTLRHTAATLALDAGVPVQDVKELLGHRSIETTLRYIRNRDSDRATRQAADRLGHALAPPPPDERA